MVTLELRSQKREELIDITPKIAEFVSASGVQKGLCFVYVPHTTAGVTINENADQDVKTDILMALRQAVPDTLPWHHAEGNATAHVKASLVGSSVSIIIERGQLQLGTWQGVYFCEFDGPRTRQVFVRVS